MENLTYELAFHLVQTLDEEAIQAETKLIEDLIGQHGGFVLHSKKPEKRHLSYPIRHQIYAFFGFIDFTISSDKIKKITDQLKLDKNVLRSMIVKKSQKSSTGSMTNNSNSEDKEISTKSTSKPRVTRARKQKTEKSESGEKIDIALDSALNKIDNI